MIPESVTSIGERALAGCKNLKNVNMENGMRLPKSIKTVGAYAFADCTGLKEVNFTNNEETTSEGIYTATVSYNAFSGCTSLEKIHFSDNVTSIGNDVLSNCSALTDVSLGNNLKTIGHDAFENCSTLSSLILPESLTTLGYWIIKGTAIENITIPKNVSKTEYMWSNGVQEGPLAGANSLKKIVLEEGMTAVPSYLCVSSAAETIVIPESVTSIGERAFGGYSNNCSLYFYGSAPGFSDTAFKDSVITAYYPKRNTTWTDEVKQNYGAASITWLGWYPRSLASFEAEYFDDNYFAKTGQAVTFNGIVFSPTQISKCWTLISKDNIVYGTVYPETTEPQLSNGSTVSTFTGTYQPLEKGSYTMETTIKLANGQSETIVTSLIVGDHFTLTPLNTDHGIHQATAVDLFRVNESGLSSSDLGKFIRQCKVSRAEGNSQIRFDCTSVKLGQSTPVTGVYMVVPDNKNPMDTAFTVTSPVGDTITCTVPFGTSAADLEKWKTKLQASADNVMTALEQYYSKIRAKMESEKNNADTQASIIELANRLQRDSSSSGYYVQMTLGDDEAEFAGYIGFANYLIHYITEGAELELIDLDDSLTEISVDLIEQVRKNLKEKKYKTSYNGYDIEIDVTSYSTSPDTSADFGSISVTKGFSTRAQGIVVSTPEKVTQAMNKYLSNLTDIVKDVAKQAIFKAFEAIEQKTSLSEVTESMINKAFKGIEDKLRTGGFGWIVDGLKIISKVKDYCEEIADIGDDDNLVDVLSKPNDLLKKITEDTIDFESGKTSSGGGITNAVNKVDTAYSAFKKTLEDYINDTEAEDLNWWQKTIKRITGACPINMILKDTEGNVLAYINDEEEFFADGIYGEKIGDITQFYVPDYMQIVVEIEAYDEGTMNYSVEELSDGEVIDRYNFYDMPLSKGSAFVNQIPPYLIQSAEDVQLETEGASILPDEQINTEGAETVQVTFGDFEGGTIIGETSYIRGDITRLSAVPESGWRFVSWHDADDNPISMQSILRLSITDDLFLIPVFEETSRPEYVIEEVTISHTSVSLTPGETKQLTASVSPASADQTITWKSSDNTIATVDSNGLVTAVSVGTAVITAAASSGLTAECTVTVVNDHVIGNIEFRHSTSFGNDLSINYYIPVNGLTGYEIISLEVKKQIFEDDGTVSWETTELTDYKQTTLSGVKYYRFPYSGIAPKEIGSEIKAVLKCEKDGESYVTEEESYNVATYAYNRLEISTDAEFKTLIVDMLNYGAWAQEYFGYNKENLVNAALTEEQKALGTQQDPELKSVEKVTETAGATASFFGKSAVFNSNVELKYYMQFAEGQSLDNVKLVLTYTAIDDKEYTEEITASNFGYDKSKKAYTAKLISIAAKDVGCTVTAKIYDGNTLISNTLEYSLETYAYNRLLKSTDEVFKAFLREFMKYGFSAKAYFNKEKQ